MANNPDLEYIKKHYSESLAHLCRSLFPTILEKPGLLPQILEKHFAHSKNLANDIISNNLSTTFQEYVFSKSPFRNQPVKTDKSVFELMLEAGYIISEECLTEAEIQSFRHYYKRDDNLKVEYKEGHDPVDYDGEELCTFGGGRLDYCRVWFAVKTNADDIKRESFNEPQRQDEYGTSVISIQFTKKNNVLSIKNRYNHTVSNPDATFSNNLDNIIPGLSYAFEKEFGLVANPEYDEFEIPGYVKANDGKMYRSNLYDAYCTYCENNIIIGDDGEVIHLPENCLLIDNFVVDLKRKQIDQFDNSYYIYKDSFPDTFKKISKIEIQKNGKNKNIVVTSLGCSEPATITINGSNQIVGYKNNNCKNIDGYFMYMSKNIENIELNNLKTCGDQFLIASTKIKDINLPLLTCCGTSFMRNCINLENVNLPSLEDCDKSFMVNCQKLTSAYLPKLEHCGESFMVNCYYLSSILANNLRTCDNWFLGRNTSLTSINLPSLVACGDNFLVGNTKINSVNLPSLKICGNCFLESNEDLQTLQLDSLQECGDSFLDFNENLSNISLQSLVSCGNKFLRNNKSLINISLPKLKKCKSLFLNLNTKIKNVDLPNLQYCEDIFLCNAVNLNSLSLCALTRCGDHFLANNTKLYNLNLPVLEVCGDFFLSKNNCLKEINLPYLTKCGFYFLENNKICEKFVMPNLHSNFPPLFFNKNKVINSIISNKAIKTDNALIIDGANISLENVNIPCVKQKIKYLPREASKEKE